MGSQIQKGGSRTELPAPNDLANQTGVPSHHTVGEALSKHKAMSSWLQVTCFLHHHYADKVQNIKHLVGHQLSSI